MPVVTISCFKCGKEMELEDRVTHNATCESCSSYLHCCRNCRFYDPNSYNMCREPQAERVKDKENANRCEFFEPTSAAPESDTRRDQALRKLNDLFKK